MATTSMVFKINSVALVIFQNLTSEWSCFDEAYLYSMGDNCDHMGHNSENLS